MEAELRKQAHSFPFFSPLGVLYPLLKMESSNRQRNVCGWCTQVQKSGTEAVAKQCVMNAKVIIASHTNWPQICPTRRLITRCKLYIWQDQWWVGEMSRFPLSFQNYRNKRSVFSQLILNLTHQPNCFLEQKQVNRKERQCHQEQSVGHVLLNAQKICMGCIQTSLNGRCNPSFC